MSRPTENQRLRAIGMLQGGLAQNIVARHFGVHRNTIVPRQKNGRISGYRDLP
jgi:transposase